MLFQLLIKKLKILRVSCFGHNLDLAIKKGLNEPRVQRALARCHSIVEMFHHSWKKTRDLRQKQDQLDLPQHKIIGDVVTRWGSTYEMVSRILEQQQAISSVLLEDRKNWHRMITDSELSVLESLVEVLKPLSYLTDALAGEKQVTASAVLPVLVLVNSKMDQSATDTALAKEIKQKIWADLSSRYGNREVSDMLNIATFLDPRFKDKHVENREDAVSLVTILCIDNYNSVHNPEAETSTPADDNASSVTDQPPAKRLKGLAAVLKQIEQETGTVSVDMSTPVQQIDKEIKAYLDFPAVEPDTDPLAWWKLENGRFPDLGHLAKKYLCICGTSVSSERVFSTAGHIASRSRGRLLPENVSKLLFLAKNIK